MSNQNDVYQELFARMMGRYRMIRQGIMSVLEEMPDAQAVNYDELLLGVLTKLGLSSDDLVAIGSEIQQMLQDKVIDNDGYMIQLSPLEILARI